MPTYALVKDGDQIGYVDTENGEAEYNGDDHFERGMVENIDNKYLGSPADDWSGDPVYLKGERMEEHLEKIADHEEVSFDIVER